MVPIDSKRLLSDLHTLRGFGASGNGVVRPSLSPVDMESRRWLAGRFTAAGLDTHIDGVGNVFGRSRKPGPAVIVGSHSDTQPRGGWLDGALGVIYGLEVVRALDECEATRELAVDAVAWVDEEGTFLGCLGSRAFCGVLTAEQVADARGADGQTLAAALAAAGLDGVSHARLESGRHRAYLEAHIEQGPHLEAGSKGIGVVTSIVGIRGYAIEFTGQQNHAGTTPMALRRDAGRALVDFAHGLHRVLESAAGPLTVWTVGNIELSPGAQSIIPGSARLLLQVRDPEDERLDALEILIREQVEAAHAAGPVGVVLHAARRPIRPTQMDEGLQAHLADAAEHHASGGWVRMPSAAGHDPMVISHHLPCAMLFVPSIDGISHDFAEDSHEDDIVLGCQVLATATAAIVEEAARDA